MASPSLVHFATMRVIVGEQSVIKGGPAGTRIIAQVDSVEISGDRITASMVGQTAADWLTVSPDKSYGMLDVRITLKTNDDELIYMSYEGRIDFATGRAMSAPLFQTGAEQYDWLNRMQAIAVGQNGPEELVYELYEVAPG